MKTRKKQHEENKQGYPIDNCIDKLLLLIDKVIEDDEINFDEKTTKIFGLIAEIERLEEKFNFGNAYET